MGLLPYLISVTNSDRNNAAKIGNIVVSIVFLLMLAVAIFLALRDMSVLQGTTSKVWLLVFAILVPEVYVIVHGLSNATMGLGFFQETMVDMPSLSKSFSPHEDALTSSLKKAGEKMKSGLSDSISALTENSLAD